MQLGIEGDKLMIAPLVATTEASGMVKGDLDLSLDLRAAGGSANQLAHALNGKLLLVEQAEADLTQLNRLTPGVRNLFGQLARSQAKLVRINCGVAAFELSGGQPQVRILVDTPDSTTVAHGHLDLGAEKLEIRVVPDPKSVHLKVAAPIVVSGSLTEPHYRIEKSGVLVSLADLATKIAVPQVMFADAFGETIAGNPCVTIATGRFKQQRAGPYKSISEPVKGGLEGTAAVVQGTGKLMEKR